MTDTVPALLQPLKDRLAAATPGPWFREYGDVITSDPDPRDLEEGYDDPRSLLIAAAPTDQAKLIAAVEAVEVMHRQDTHYGPYYCICGGKWPCATVAALTQALGGETA